MKIRKVALHELDEFIRSEEFKQFDVKPITPMRAASYLRNPYARPNDFVLYMLVRGSKLLAFRSLFAGKLTGENEAFAWLSGNWVHPDFRRKGLSEKLLKEALKDWNARLMFTNYAPDSLQLYLKTGKFEPVYADEGHRFYLFAETSKILGERFKKLKFLLPVFDIFIHTLSSIKITFYKPETESIFQTKLIELPDQECIDLIKSNKKEMLFLRDNKSLKWIFKHPWLSTVDNRFIKIYPFSSFAKSFKYQTLKVFSDGHFLGFLLYSIRDGHLKTLYHFLQDEAFVPASNHLAKIAVTEKIGMITIFDPQLADNLKRTKAPFIYDKKIDHRIYSSFKPENKGRKIQSGDGDFIFT